MAEIMNHTIVEKVRRMLRMARLPNSFRGEAIRTACYLINWSPSVTLDFEILEEMETRNYISYSYLKAFGCKAFTDVPKKQQLKLNDKVSDCIFVGYGDVEFTIDYRI